VSIQTLDLRGRPAPEQIRLAQAAVGQAATGTALQINTDLEIVATSVLAAAAGQGLAGRVEPPAEGTQKITISPGKRPAAAIPDKEEETDR
jgi:TusA-related sulfurtransferase